MSVELEGIKGYEYQYKATALIALIYLGKIKELYIEPRDGEDSRMIINYLNKSFTIEIQVKREKQLLQLPKLINWLCHFQWRSVNSNLLTRVSKESDIIVLFITRSRCSDDTVLVKKDIGDIQLHESLSIRKEWKKSFLKYLSSNALVNDRSKLRPKRQEYCRKQAIDFQSVEHLTDVLKRIIIWEELSDSKIDDTIINELNHSHQIVHSASQHTYLLILERIKMGRDKGDNIITDIRDLILLHQGPHPENVEFYFKREEEEKLHKILDKKNVLLLTGISQCGKTEIANRIAFNYYEKGFEFIMSNVIEEIQRFFSTNTKNSKIAILEDPWGHVRLDPDHTELSRKIELLIKNVIGENKLIITSKKEILYEKQRTTLIEDMKVNNHSWIDLTIHNEKVVNEYWYNTATRLNLPKPITKIISNSLQESAKDQLLQFGQLNYLANQEISKLSDLKSQDLENIARHNSKDVAAIMYEKDPYIAEILAILGVCSTTISSTRVQDLGYILSDDSNLYALRGDDRFQRLISDDEVRYPQYTEDYDLSEGAINAIEYLEERQLITNTSHGIRFTHPNYFEAGRNLFLSQSITRQNRFLKSFKRCLACLNPSSAFNASKQFKFLYSGIHDSLKDKLIEIAFSFLKSIFPHVEDNCMIFLMDFIGLLDQEKSHILTYKIQRGGTDTFNIHWHEMQIPFISDHGGFQNLLFEIQDDIVSDTYDKLKNKNPVNSYNAWMFLLHWEKKGLSLIEIDVLKSLLNYNEAFIRSLTAFLYFRDIKANSEDITEIIFQDEHPNVVFNAIRGIFISWHEFNSKSKELLFNTITIALNNKQVAIRTFNLTMTFSIDYSGEGIHNWRELNEFQKKDLWNLWGKIFPIAVNEMPREIHTNYARFSKTMDEAMHYINIDLGLKVLESWFNVIDKKVKEGLFVDDFQCGIADNMMTLTKEKSIKRKELFKKIFMYEDTYFLLLNLNYITYYWEYLDTFEKQVIYNLLEGNRKDIRWIKAALLNSHNPISELSEKILGKPDFFAMGTDEIIQQFPKELLNDCLNVFCGSIFPLSYLAHHRNHSFWNTIIKQILLDQSNPNFKLCLDEFLGFGVNALPPEWQDGIILWKVICTKANDIKELTKSLLYHTAISSVFVDDTKALWTILIDESSNRGEEDQVIEIISENIEILQETGDRKDILEIFEKGILEKIINRLSPDKVILETLATIEVMDKEDYGAIPHLYSDAFANINKEGIRIFVTFKYIVHIQSLSHIPQWIKDDLSTFKDNIHERGEADLEKWRKLNSDKLEDWIKTNETQI